MADAAIIDFSPQWGDDFAYVFAFADSLTGLPVDFTGYVGLMQVRSSAGLTGAALATAALTFDRLNGEIQAIIPSEVLQFINGGQEVWRGAYDLRLTDPTGLRKAWARGSFSIEPTVSAG